MIKKYFFIAVLITIPTTLCFAQTSTTQRCAVYNNKYVLFYNHGIVQNSSENWWVSSDSSAEMGESILNGLTQATLENCQSGASPTSQSVPAGGLPSPLPSPSIDPASESGLPTHSDAIQQIPTTINVPATTAPSPSPTANNRVKLIVLAKKSGTNRPIGAVKITMTDGTKSQDVTLSDPPDPNGQAIFQAIPGKYTLNVSRAGYRPITNKQVELTSGGDLKISIDLVADAYTASPELEYQARMLAQYYANTNNPTNLGYPYNSYSNTSQFGSQYPNFNSGTAPYNSYPQQYPTNLNQNAGAYPYNSTNQYSPTMAQNGYMLSSNQSSVIPIIVNAQMNGLFSANQNSTVTLINPSTGNSIIIFSGGSSGSVSVSTLTNQFTRSGCVSPNTQYVLRVSSNGQIQTTQLPYQDFPFISPGIGSYVNVNIQPPLSISYGASNLANTTIQNYPLQNSTQLGFTCPSTYNSSSQTPAWPVPSTNYNYPQTTPQTQYGTTTWTDQVINPTNFGAYHVVQDPLKTGYFVISNINAFDQRQITFIQSNSNTGGLAFVPAESTITGSSSYSSQWYMTTYTRNGNTPTLEITKLTKVNFTPAEYQQAVSGQVLNSF